MREKRFILIIAVFVFLLTFVQGAEAESEEWEFLIAPYGWLAGVDGAVTAKGVEVDVDKSPSDFFDIVSDIDFVAELHMEAKKGPWIILLDPTYLKVSTDGKVGPVDADVTTEFALVDIAGLYRFYERPIGADNSRKLSFDVLAGARYWHLESDIDLELRLERFNLKKDFEARKDWIDPILGLRTGVNLTRKLTLWARADIGGFGVGSDFSWNVSAVLGYDVYRNITLALGYRVLDVNFEDGSGDDKTELNATLHGPMLGLVFFF